MRIVFQSAKDCPVGQRLSDGYVNATALCKACGKKVSHWLELDTTNAYIAALAVDAGITASEIVQIRKGGHAHEQGTWVHPHAAIYLAQWCSPEFAVLVSKWVVGWMSAGQSPAQPAPLQLREIKSSDDLPPAGRAQNQAELCSIAQFESAWMLRPGYLMGGQS